MKSKSIMRCMLLALFFLVLGLAWTPNIMAQELSCSASNNVIVTPSPTTVHSGDEIVWTISITNKCITNYAPIQGVPALLIADGGSAFHPPLELTMAVGRPGTFTFLNCTDLAAGMDHCALKPGNPNIILLYTTAGGVSFTAGQTVMLAKVHAKAVTPVPTTSHAAVTNIVGFYDPLEAQGVYHTTGALCNPQVHSGAQGTTVEFFPPKPCIDVKKSVNPLKSKPTDEVVYTIELCNCGDVALNSITVSDTKLGSLVPPFPTTLAAGTVSDSTIIPNCVTHTFNHTIPPGTTEDPYVNIVTATGTPAGETQAISDVAQASVNLFQPAIDVTKTCDAVSKVGDTVNYTITLSNNSSADTPALNCTAVDSLLGNVFGPAVLPLGNTVVNRQRVVQPGDPDPLVNTVTLTCSPQGFPNVLEASDECQTNLVQPSCSISKTCSPDPLVVGKPITWEITLNNTGGIALNICIEDTVAQISTCELVQPLGSTTLTSSRTVTAEDCPSELGTSANITNTAKATATVVGIGNKISCGEDTATCTCPQTELFGCRMTGGHPRFNPNGECVTDPLLLADVKKIRSVRSHIGTNFFTVQEKIWYSVGGQIGAPDARCCNTPPGSPGRDEECPSGSWEHVHHQGTISWNSSTFSGGFAFHSGTASAPDDAYIRSIICADKGWCVQARCAPAKQIFWDGTGVFHNINLYTHFPDCRPVPVRNKKGATPTIHYYRAHVADFGEPAGCTDNQKPKGQCPWRSNGVGVVSEDGCSLDGSPVVIPWPLDEKFGDKGGQDCSGVCVNNRCGECPDWYEIEIHCTDDPGSPIIYKVGDFITHGNHQIHPEVGSNCFDAFPNP